MPSRWECWPYVALEAACRGRPVLATATGGMTELVADPASGRLAQGTSVDALEQVLAPLVERPAPVRDPGMSGSARELFSSLTDPGPIREAYRDLCEARDPDPPGPGRPRRRWSRS